MWKVNPQVVLESFPELKEEIEHLEEVQKRIREARKKTNPPIRKEDILRVAENLRMGLTRFERDYYELYDAITQVNRELSLPFGKDPQEELAKIRRKFPSWAFHIRIRKISGRWPFIQIQLPATKIRVKVGEAKILGVPRDEINRQIEEARREDRKPRIEIGTFEVMKRIRERRKKLIEKRRAKRKGLKRLDARFDKEVDKTRERLLSQLRMLRNAINQSTTSDAKRAKVRSTLMKRLQPTIQSLMEESSE